MREINLAKTLSASAPRGPRTRYLNFAQAPLHTDQNFAQMRHRRKLGNNKAWVRGTTSSYDPDETHPSTSMCTPPSDVSSVFDDSSLWDDADESPLKETSLWVPVGTTQTDTWNLLLPNRREYTIHGGAIGMIIFLELCFSANGYGQRNVMKNRLAHYILRLRKLVEKELESTIPDQLLESTWQPRCLRQWAVRVNHGFHHSPMGRVSYQEYCARNKWRPYLHDNPLVYGKF
jgi:hypothetical protein